MTLTFENEQDFDLGFDPEEVAAAVINGVLDQEACPYEAEVELILTDPENIRTMNREHRNIDRETDVLSFPMVDYPSPASFDFLFPASEQHHASQQSNPQCVKPSLFDKDPSFSALNQSLVIPRRCSTSSCFASITAASSGVI